MAKVLIIEDNATIAKIWRVQLERSGHEVAVAARGVEALELVGNVNPDIILTDLMLPGMNGFEVVEKLRGREDTKDIPIIILTATSSHQNKERAALMGVHSYIVKSECTPRQLSEAVSAALGAAKTN
jgi:CheY-like chemotaxis protein